MRPRLSDEDPENTLFRLYNLVVADWFR